MPSEKRARQRALRNQKVAYQERRHRRSRRVRRVIGALVVVGIVIGLVVALSGKSPKHSATSTTTTKATSTTTATSAAIAPVCPPSTSAGAARRVTAFKAAPPICISRTGHYDATLRTDVGTFVVSLSAASSLAAVNNFIFLARYHFYDGVTFHRVIPGFMVQGGDPTGTGGGGPGYSFTGNTPPASCAKSNSCYPLYGVAMANSQGPSTNGSQFFIVTGAEGESESPDYTLFGRVISGTAVVQRIAADGNSNPSANGIPPKVLHHIDHVTITQVA